MRVTDFSPQFPPSLAQQREALQQGLGRAMQWALAGHLADEPLLDACLHDKRYDPQCEDNRGEWLWNIMNSAGAVERLREPILESLRCVTAERDAYQLCELGFHYAKKGDGAFKTSLYEFVEKRSVPDCPWIGEGQLLELGGEGAFQRIAHIRGNALAKRDWDWDDAAVTERAVEKLGEQRVSDILSSTGDAAVRRFATGWRKHSSRSREPQRPSHAERMRAITVGEILTAAKADNPRSAQLSFRGWGMRADERDLEVVLQQLWASSEPRVIANLLKVFSNRPLPRFDARLIELCRHDDPEVQRWAINALEVNNHPRIRAFALAELRERTLAKSIVGLFINNYSEGDEHQLLELLELPDEPDSRHNMLMETLEMLEKNPNANCSQLGLIAYAQTPCELCRYRAVELLAGRSIAPKWLIHECRHDSFEDSRELFQAT